LRQIVRRVRAARDWSLWREIDSVTQRASRLGRPAMIECLEFTRAWALISLAA